MKSFSHSNRTSGCWAVTLLVMLPVFGCKTWNTERFDLSRLRDERAVDLETRLSKALPIAEDSFQFFPVD